MLNAAINPFSISLIHFSVNSTKIVGKFGTKKCIRIAEFKENCNHRSAYKSRRKKSAFLFHIHTMTHSAHREITKSYINKISVLQ